MRWGRHKREAPSFQLGKRLTRIIRGDINEWRTFRYMPPLEFVGELGFQYVKGEPMADAYCGPCKDAGYGNIIAHYHSHRHPQTGQLIPAKCHYHHFNMPIPASVSGKAPLVAGPYSPPEKAAEIQSTTETEKDMYKPLPKQPVGAKCACGCGTLLNGSKWRYVRGHRPAGASHHKKEILKDTDIVVQKPVPASVILDRANKSGSQAIIVKDVLISETFIDAYWKRLTLDEKIDAIFGEMIS